MRIEDVFLLPLAWQLWNSNRICGKTFAEAAIMIPEVSELLNAGPCCLLYFGTLFYAEVPSGGYFEEKMRSVGLYSS